MARTHLTLAALATSAVDGLDVVRATPAGSGAQGDFDSALLTARDGRQLIIRVPTGQPAETEQSADLIALRSLTAGIRSRLPFDVPTYLGQTPIDGTRAVVYDFLAGAPLRLEDVRAGDGLAGSVGRSIAAIHALPTAFVGDAGLPVLTAAECLSSTEALIEAAVGTGLVPTALRDRWRAAVRDTDLWQFQPTVINGALTAESFLVEGETVVGVLGWSALRVGDPARDLHWVLAMATDSAESTLGAYAAARHVATDRQFTHRALLYAELEVARWLLHGRELHEQSIVDDAVQMLDGLVDRVHTNTADRLSHATGPVLDVSDVEDLLDQTPGDRSGDDFSPSEGLKPMRDDQSEESSSSE
jgi:aminoglycoside phosphotransferase (APT) family kinase protein